MNNIYDIKYISGIRYYYRAIRVTNPVGSIIVRVFSPTAVDRGLECRLD